MLGAVGTCRLSMCVCATATVLAAWLIPSPALAENDKPASASEGGFLTLDRFDAYLEFVGDYRRTRVRTADPSPLKKNRTQRNKEWGLEERIGLKLGGTLIDPSFITYSGDFSFALTQNRFEEDIGSFDRSYRQSGSA